MKCIVCDQMGCNVGNAQHTYKKGCILERPIGTYRFVLAAGNPPLYGDKEIYEVQEKYLDIPKKTMTQVRLKDGTWINVEPRDIKLFS